MACSYFFRKFIFVRECAGRGQQLESQASAYMYIEQYFLSIFRIYPFVKRGHFLGFFLVVSRCAPREQLPKIAS